MSDPQRFVDRVVALVKETNECMESCTEHAAGADDLYGNTVRGEFSQQVHRDSAAILGPLLGVQVREGVDGTHTFHGGTVALVHFCRLVNEATPPNLAALKAAMATG